LAEATTVRACPHYSAILRDKGLLTVGVSDSAYPTFRLYREHWLPYGIPKYLQHFTSTTVQQLLLGAKIISGRQNDHQIHDTLSFINSTDRLSILGPRKACPTSSKAAR
jgi:hypothetical protein